MALALSLDRPLVEGALRGPDGLTAEEKARVVDTVRRYNAILRDAYATGGVPALIDDLPAIDDLKEDVRRDLSYVENGGLVLVYDLASFTALGVVAAGLDQAEVVAYEEWAYVYQRASDRTPVSEIEEMGVAIRYRLEKRDGSWAIVSWEPEEAARPDGRAEAVS